jgi:hypothetical protein
MLKKSVLSNQGGLIRNAEKKITGDTGVGLRGKLVKTAATEVVDRMAPRPFSPFYEETNLNLPRNRPEINAWCRHYYNTDPWVGNAIDLHSTYPLSSFGVKCKSLEITKFFNEMLDDLNFGSMIYEIAREYFILGEVFPMMELDEVEGKWSKIIIQNPDYVEVSKHNLTDPMISILPDAELQKMLTSTNPDHIRIREQLKEKAPEFLQYVFAGKPYPVPPTNIAHIARKTSPYDVRGTSILTRVFKDLMYRDIIREAQFTIAQNHITPLRLVKVGNTDGSYRPNAEDLVAFRQLLEEATYDPNFTIVTHTGVEIQYIGASGAILQVDSEMERIEDRVLTGLFLSKAFTHSEGPTYNNATVALEVLQQRYVSFRNIIERWLERKIFAPIARLNDFYEYDNGVKKLIIPKVDWQKINLKNNREYQGALEGLARDNKVSMHSLYSALDLNYEEETTWIKKEIEDQKEIAYKIQTPYQGKENINVSSMGAEEFEGKPEGETEPGQGMNLDETAGGGGGGGGLDLGGGGEAGGGGLDLGGGGESGGGEAGGGLDLGGPGGGAAPAPPAPPA